MTTVGKIALFFSGVALLFSILALASTVWIYSDFNNFSLGLWKGCESNGRDGCSGISRDTCVVGKSASSSVSSQQHACQATRAFAILFFIFAFFAFCLQFTVRKIGMMACSALAALWGLIAMSIYVDNSGNKSLFDAKYGWGFALLVVGWLLEIVVAGMNMVDTPKDHTTTSNDRSQPMNNAHSNV